ncbi:MAG: ATP phosphoribosyltransferase [Oscillospiraceae bacterium]|jgi:ATP phosphoribosyltransferase|nr:ATP phosphoribosyltransferase [Oscillospiraceae bacterium]
MLNIALPKGRLADRVLERLALAGCGGASLIEGSRRLVVEDPEGNLRYFLVKPSDVAVYVLHGAADVGIVGRDILLETKPDVYELLDLKLGACRMVVAGPPGAGEGVRTRVATKYPNIARKHYADSGREIDLIALNGSIELAPLVGLSDVIVDVVETGGTLRDNGLIILEEIIPISARLIANIASAKFKAEGIDDIMKALSREGN